MKFVLSNIHLQKYGIVKNIHNYNANLARLFRKSRLLMAGFTDVIAALYVLNVLCVNIMEQTIIGGTGVQHSLDFVVVEITRHSAKPE